MQRASMCVPQIGKKLPGYTDIVIFLRIMTASKECPWSSSFVSAVNSDINIHPLPPSSSSLSLDLDDVEDDDDDEVTCVFFFLLSLLHIYDDCICICSITCVKKDTWNMKDSLGKIFFACLLLSTYQQSYHRQHLSDNIKHIMWQIVLLAHLCKLVMWIYAKQEKLKGAWLYWQERNSNYLKCDKNPLHTMVTNNSALDHLILSWSSLLAE